MSLAACAELVRRGDPDRFLAAMAAAPGPRATLLTLYAFNLEVARAPWASREPMIGQMRLTFWREVLAEIEAGAPPRAHEVARPLAELAGATPLPLAVLDAMVVARWADLERAGFAEAAALWTYLDQTAGGLMWASAAALGAGPADEAPVRAVGRAGGLANWLLAVPELQRRGLRVDVAGLDGLVAGARRDLAAARGHRFGPGVPALRAAWRAGPVLARAASDPTAILEGRLEGSEFARRSSLLWRAFTGRW